MSQTQIILELLEKGPVTLPVARAAAGCERLAARIKDLRDDGHVIETVALRLPNGKTVAEYHLRKKKTTPTMHERGLNLKETST
jgi:hypothetical protein